MMMRKKIYVAAPLFSLAERTFNAHLKQELSSHFDIYLPQEDGHLVADLVSRGCTPQIASRVVFDADLGALSQIDICLAVLDGRVIDEGVSFELGFAYALCKPCYGIQTDVRRCIAGQNNPMIQEALRATFVTVEDAVANLAIEYDGVRT